jgi:hypothetical protein
VVHYYDIVPHMPQELLGYHHVTTEVWYNEASSSYKVRPRRQLPPPNALEHSAMPPLP